eukprot:16060-Rhodomonas_salina.1
MQQAGLGCPVSPAVSPAGRGLAAARAAAAAASSSAAAACGSASAAAAALPQQQTLTFGQSFKNDSNPHAAQVQSKPRPRWPGTNTTARAREWLCILGVPAR